MTRLTRARDVLEHAVAASVFPGAAVEVGTAEGPVETLAVGRLGYGSDSPAAAVSSIYDLASLTKVLATTALALEAVSRGRVRLDDRVSRWVPAWTGEDRQGVTLRHLLEHSSGLPAHRPYYRSLHGADRFVRAICEEPLAYRPGSQSDYSDPGFMLLGFALEAAVGVRLDAQFDAWRDREVGPRNEVRYGALPAWLDRTAPTERDPWRGRLLVGEVHDENAAALDGVAGHAGLFGTAAAVGACARWWLRHALEAHRPTRRSPSDVVGAVVAAFLQPSPVPGSSRALGWDTMRPTSSCGRRLSEAAFGHTGFTGTSLWIDPTPVRQGPRLDSQPSHGEGLYVVFLSNRVHPSRTGEGIGAVRQALHDALIEDLG